MPSGTQGAADYYVWHVSGKTVTIHLNLEVVDRLLADMTRAFSAVPRHGAEIGGLLLGTIEQGDTVIVRVDDFEPVESQYKNGPSYLLSDEDRARFQSACEHWQPDEARPLYAVGYYRSNTREAASLAPQDIELLDEFFPSPAHIGLLINFHARRTSTAGFFFREDGLFPRTTQLEFPFRRRELSAGDDPPARPRREPAPSPAPPAESDYRREAPWRPAVTPVPSTPASGRFGLRSAVWIPLSFVFLMFGMALGLMIALARGSGPSAHEPGDFSLGLAVTRSDDNLSVRWDREATAIHAADHGVLEIEDGSYTKSVDLDTAQLKNGSIIYRNSSDAVRFRLVVYPKAHVSVTETADWGR
jgi:hypothetical protein